MSEIVEVHQSEIVDSRWQTRQNGYSGPKFEELVESIRRHGITKLPGVFLNEAQQHELVYGHRTVAAARKASIQLILAVLVDRRPAGNPQGQLDRFQQLVLADNMGHEDLTSLELARALQALIQQQGLSQGDVGKLYGKSQQWVSDKVKLLDLAAPVQQALTARSVEETVARALAKLPEDYQAPVMEYVKGKPSREATRIIGEIEAATDPGFWDLPEDEAWAPQQMNVKRVMDHLLGQIPRQGMGGVLGQLQEDGLLKRPERMQLHELYRFAASCGLAWGQSDWQEWEREQGHICDNCVFKDDGLFWCCGEENRQSCNQFLRESDPVRLPAPFAEGDEQCQACEQEHGWCTDVGCYIQKLKSFRAAEKEGQGEVQLDAMMAAQERLRRFYDRQLQDDVDNDHWLAQACEHCKTFRGKDQREQCGLVHPRRAHTMFWESGGVMVPRCTEFHLQDVYRIPEADKGSFETILLAWIEEGIVNLDWLWEHEKTAMEEIRKLGLGQRRLCALVSLMMNQAVVNSWSPKAELINPITGEKETWKQVKEKEATEEAG